MDPTLTDYNLVIHILFLISSSLSVFASFFTFLIYYKYRHLSKNYPTRLIVLISLTDALIWFVHVINLMSRLFNDVSFETDSENYCLISSIFRCFCVLFNLCCIFLIGFSLFYEIVLYRKADKIEGLGYVFSFIFSLIFALIPFYKHKYGVLDAYQCWITDNELNLIIFYCPLILVFICDLIFIFYIMHHLRKLKSHFKGDSLMLKFMMFPFILIVSWLPGFIRIAGNLESTTLDGFMYIFMPFQGIFNPIIYGSIFTMVKNEVLWKGNVINECVNENSNNSSTTMTYEDLMKIGKMSEINGLMMDFEENNNVENVF